MTGAVPGVFLLPPEAAQMCIEACMTLEELGAALRAEREKRMLDIEDAASRLKISARLLRALEEGDEASLPPPAYTRGFLRSYAAFVGFSPEEVSAAVGSLTAASRPVTPQPVYEPAPDAAPPRRSFKPALALLVLLAAGGGLFVAWQQGVLDVLGQQTRRLVQPAPVQNGEHAGPAAQSETPAVPPAAEPAKPVAAGPQTPAAEPPAPQPAARPAGPAASAASPALPPESSAAQAPPSRQPAVQPQSAQGAAAPPAASPERTHKVVITAIEECWVHSSADKTDTRQFSLRRGDTFALTFSTSLELKLGNAGGVRLRYDGEELPPAGRAGQVRTLSFPPAAAGGR